MLGFGIQYCRLNTIIYIQIKSPASVHQMGFGDQFHGDVDQICEIFIERYLISLCHRECPRALIDLERVTGMKVVLFITHFKSCSHPSQDWYPNQNSTENSWYRSNEDECSTSTTYPPNPSWESSGMESTLFRSQRAFDQEALLYHRSSVGRGFVWWWESIVFSREDEWIESPIMILTVLFVLGMLTIRLPIQSDLHPSLLQSRFTLFLQ